MSIAAGEPGNMDRDKSDRTPFIIFLMVETNQAHINSVL